MGDLETYQIMDEISPLILPVFSFLNLHKSKGSNKNSPLSTYSACKKKAAKSS
jgi:hypothetical protein